jgi:hypothetical protein
VEEENKEIKALTPVYEMTPMEVPERNPLLVEAMAATGVTLDQLTLAQRLILISLQSKDFFFMPHKTIAEQLELSLSCVRNAMANPVFQKVYLYIQSAMLLTHLPEIDNATIRAALSEKGTDKDRMLAYMRLGLLDKKGLTVNINQNNNTVNATNTNGKQLCPADALVDRWSGSPVEPDKFRGKKTIIQEPDKD